MSTATPEWSTRTILHYAVIYNRPDIVKVFIEAGAGECVYVYHSVRVFNSLLYSQILVSRREKMLGLSYIMLVCVPQMKILSS